MVLGCRVLSLYGTSPGSLALGFSMKTSFPGPRPALTPSLHKSPFFEDPGASDLAPRLFSKSFTACEIASLPAVDDCSGCQKSESASDESSDSSSS